MGGSFQIAIPLSPVVKKLIIINLFIWFFGVLILQKWLLSSPLIYQWFGLVPASTLLDYWLWQPFTYLFVHSDNVFHVIFNMLILWWFGSELEAVWGGRFFLLYYLASGVGAGILYLFGILIYSIVSGNGAPLTSPVVGASGAMFGVMIAYAMTFGDRMVYFMMMFPMNVRAFVAVIGAIEVLNLLSSGVSSQTANLAHLGGLVSGFIFLKIYHFWKNQRVWQKYKTKKKTNGSGLKLVINNKDENNKSNQPKYWN
ncbi:MAG: rhomboid family intramembrane serine protease [Bdellovibrionales bacterium]|nr:rhomboid family intramembrane serine protease [Bdellovibrionales bacterium]